MKKFHIKTKEKSCYLFDTWITKLEMRAFGWKYKGMNTDYLNKFDIDIDWENETATVTQRFKTYTTFKRIEPYSYNFLFIMLETFMIIHSWIRRKLIFLLFFLFAAVVVINLIEFSAWGWFSSEFWIALGFFGYIYLPSLFYAFMGFLTRKIFGLDQKLKNRLEKNGYAREQEL